MLQTRWTKKRGQEKLKVEKNFTLKIFGLGPKLYQKDTQTSKTGWGR